MLPLLVLREPGAKDCGVTVSLALQGAHSTLQDDRGLRREAKQDESGEENVTRTVKTINHQTQITNRE